MGTAFSLHSWEMTKRTFFAASSFVAIVACGGQVTSLGSVGDETLPDANGNVNGDGTDSRGTEQSSQTPTGEDVDAGPADGGGTGGGGSGKACNPFVTSPSSQCPTGEYCHADVP